METFANQIKSCRQTRHSLCSRMLKAFALMFVTVGLAQAEVTELACSPTQELRIDNPGEYVLAEDCAVQGDGISITASGVQLNLDGHTLSGPGCDPRTTGITVFGSNVHVTGGTVKGFSTGVSVRPNPPTASADHNQLSDLTVTENCTGIELRFSDNNQVNFNNVSGNFRDGVVVHRGSDNNQVNFNVINENGVRDDPNLNGHGILVAGSDSNVLAFNVISRNEQGGVRLISEPSDDQVRRGSNNNTIAGNVVTETEAFEGIIVQVGKNNTIHGNLSSRNLVGIELQPTASENFVLRNTALGNTRVDLRDLNPDCDNNKWKSNNFNTDEVAGQPDGGPGVGCIQ